MDVSAWLESVEASAHARVDLLHDAVAGEVDVDVREAYIDLALGDFDFRLGRQIATWGVGDLLFINDVFPKDWVSFFSGRPLEYLKIGVDGFRARYSSDLVNAELLVVPFFTPDNVPTSERFFLYDPFAGISARDERRPETTYSNTELALRVYRNVGGFDVSLFAYRGFWRTPSMEPDSLTSPTRVTAFYPALSVYGLGAQGSFLGGILSMESGYYRSRDDEGGDDAAVRNSEVRFLVGYERQLWEDFTIGVQYYGEVLEDHSDYVRSLPVGWPPRKEYRDTVVVRLQQLLSHQTWSLSLVGFYSPVGGDYLLQPQVTYKLWDNLSATIGANTFGGQESTTSLGQLDKNDNIYISVRFDL